MYVKVNCKNCIFWEEEKSHLATTRGRCYHSAPKPRLFGELDVTKNATVVWPRTQADNWCRDAAQKAVDLNENG